ncbi:hypothetical protein V492_06159 [Pseudogymnoascus sp. VKM F-4246]|nr:hypothetical protein V492_06159 [Pseudogymnoascus sp. VKM F-4246]
MVNIEVVVRNRRDSQLCNAGLDHDQHDRVVTMDAWQNLDAWDLLRLPARPLPPRRQLPIQTCQFRHATAATTRSPKNAKDTKPLEETEIEATYRKWKYMIPKPNTYHARFGTTMNIELFLQIGWNIIESEDAGTRQDVITKLGAEEGLSTVKSITDTMDVGQTDETSISIFKDRTIPLYRIISHPDVLGSLILETPMDTIYTFFFGPSGRRGLGVFRFTAKALSVMILGSAASDEEASIIAISSSLAVLDRLIEINQSAQVIDGFSSIVETISACIPESLMAPNAQQSLTRIRRRLNLGSSFPLASTQPAPQNIIPATFELSQDLPGNLSKIGARHDNDHASIADIMILPTAQEIASQRQEYLPLIDPTQHHLLGLAGLLDRQFRLLREDTVGQLRDAVREEFMRLERPNRSQPTEQKGQQAIRKLVYHNACFSHMSVDRRRGLQVVVCFKQPAQLKNKSAKHREDWWKGSKLLEPDSLVCFVSSNGRIIFLSVCNPIFIGKDSDSDDRRRLDDIPSLSRKANRASVLLSLADYKSEDVNWISTHIGSSQARQSLVEFPGVLLPSFQPTLQALQKMSRKLDLPFAEVIAPDSQASPIVIKPPAYSTKRGFSFSLDVHSGEPLLLTPGQPFDFTQLEEGSSLDEAQQHAVIQALSLGLACIQGPPGTGKSYTGEALIKTLLKNRKAATLGPIICVCYTNHALDQLLEHLVNGGVEQVIRLGSRSKSEVLQNLTIRHVAKEVVPTKTEKHNRWLHNRDIGDILREIEGLLSGLNNPKSWTSIHAYLAKTHNRHFMELFGKGVDAEGFREVKGKKFRAVESWLRGAPKNLISNRPVTELAAISLKEMSTLERNAIYEHWVNEHISQLSNTLIQALNSYNNSRSALDKCHSELDLRCLQQAHIIGVTTSGLARNIELLQRVGAKVMLCEEAGEVLEAHTLTAFLPGVEHVILIGDHEQLRPQINNFELQHDNPRGKKYSLDISLFERLVKPQTGSFQVPLSTLKTQRRMHPSISELVKIPLYPDLQDHPSVSEYPEVDGMRHRLYWLDHQESEDRRSDQSVSLSRTNSFEVEMVASLVSHLVRQGTYGREDIAVITPYLGQLQRLKKRLANSFEIVVGDRDQEELEAQGLQDDLESSKDGKIQIQKTTLLNSLRIATVDNFQGEEAKVIVVSLVRSNKEQKCGFLRTSNRINVLLSRARHGMYIIGNSNTSRPVPMWAEVLSILERSNNIGRSLALCCPRHKETAIEVSVPDDFSRLAPEGGYHTPPAVMAAKLYAMGTRRVLFAQNNAKLAVVIQSAASYVMNHVHHVQKTVLGLVLIVDGAHYHAQCLKGMVVDFILSSTFEEIDLSNDPCIIPPCGHILTVESMDGHMSMSDFYAFNSEGLITNLKNTAEPFSASALKSCPTCRGPLRNLNRYSRIVRRALIDESTKKFIVWANSGFIPLVARMQAVETQFRETDRNDQKVHDRISTKLSPLAQITLNGTRNTQISQISQIESLLRNGDRYKTIIELRWEISKFLDQVNEKEQPFGRVYDLVQDSRRHRGINTDLDSKIGILQVRNRLLTSVLLIRCDYTILLTFIGGQKDEISASYPRIRVDFSINRKDCEELISESHSRNQPGNTVEGHLYWARFLALERGLEEPGSELTQLLDEARNHLKLAYDLCDKYPGQTAGMKNEVEDVEKMLRDSTFYMPVSNDEKAAVYAAMAQDFRGTGHWYYCANGHPFTVGECGMPMQTSQCPQCGSQVGGHDHQAVGGVTRATDLEEQFGGVRI